MSDVDSHLTRVKLEIKAIRTEAIEKLRQNMFEELEEL